ncbi:hypothetical protein PK98_15240 [Croceibacterium mercuriale]|uniref:Uncharacterized protein n=1 Tax=Croceibacterium mercuriale TaxID=1572751 RepID=A0A0B2BRG5_9SPHN|nr:hypothetical protein PK98_15240 [Croceibacterium mercuriale]
MPSLLLVDVARQHVAIFEFGEGRKQVMIEWHAVIAGDEGDRPFCQTIAPWDPTVRLDMLHGAATHDLVQHAHHHVARLIAVSQHRTIHAAPILSRVCALLV